MRIGTIRVFLRRGLLGGALAVLAISIGSIGAAALAEPLVEVQYDHYDVRGDTAESLLRQIEAERGADGFHAETKWHVSWWVEWQSTESACQIVDVQIKIDVEYLLPRWQGLGESDDQRLVDRWKRYERALRDHERGHGEIGIEAGREVETALLQMSSRHDCERLGADADSLARQIVDQHQERDLDYDRVTNNGATQGAIFP